MNHIKNSFVPPQHFLFCICVLYALGCHNQAVQQNSKKTNFWKTSVYIFSEMSEVFVRFSTFLPQIARHFFTIWRICLSPNTHICTFWVSETQRTTQNQRIHLNINIQNRNRSRTFFRSLCCLQFLLIHFTHQNSCTTRGFCMRTSLGCGKKHLFNKLHFSRLLIWDKVFLIWDISLLGLP